VKNIQDAADSEEYRRERSEVDCWSISFLFEDFSAPSALYFIILGDRQKIGRTRFDQCGKPSGKSAEHS